MAWAVAHLLLLSCVFSLAQAEELTDPTRPPVSVSAPVDEPAAIKPVGLQSIFISKSRRAAIIDGETVELGEKHGAAQLIAVNEGNVVLRGAHGPQVLRLFPDVRIQQHRVVDAPTTSHQAGNKPHQAKRIVHREKK